MSEKRYNEQCAQKFHYCAFDETRYHIDLGRYNTYGVWLVDSESGEIFHDVSTCEQTAFRIAWLLNLHQVFPEHFRDVVEDLIQD